MKNKIKFATLIFSIITFSTLMAHLLALPNKIHLSGKAYLTVQGIYKNWALLGTFEIGAIILTLIWVIREWRRKPYFAFLLAALICQVMSLALFFLFTFPANQATANWMQLPENWETLRSQLEYSHAARAALNLTNVCLLLWVPLMKGD